MEEEKKNINLEDEFCEEYLEDIEYVQASTIKDLEKKIRKKIEDDYGIIEQNPFWDDQTKQWTQIVLYYNDGSEDTEDNIENK